MKKIGYYILIMFILVISISSCATNKFRIFDLLAEIPAKNFENYEFDPSSKIISRISETPDFLLNYFKEMDNVDDYKSYLPSNDEIEIIELYLAQLPPLTKTTLQEKLVGFYFIENFIGSGLADYVIDQNNVIYAILVINPATLKNDISPWMTHRENTCFINDSENIKIEIHCGNEYLGLMYILLHESTHIVDYVHFITPYTEENIKALKMGNVKRTTPFTHNIWNNRNEVYEGYSNNYQEKITFYGLSGGPKLSLSEAPNIYEEMAQMPFVSLYGSMNWAEDLAEMTTWYHYTEKLNQPYEINIYDGTTLINKYKPLQFENVAKRLKTLEIMY